MERSGWMALAAVAAVCCGQAAQAEHTRFWRVSQYSELIRGTAENVAIWSDGRLEPTLALRTYADPGLAYLWAAARDHHGRVYVAGGSPARVVRLEGPGRMTTVFQSAELTAQALAFDAQDHLYVATSPDGKIYRVTADGHASVFYAPPAKYIWALAVDTDGTLFAGTGDRGEIFAVTTDGHGAVFYHTAERHIRSLRFDAQGNLIVGTEPHGLVMRVSVHRQPGQLPKAGAAFVLDQTAGREVTALSVDSAGNLLVASVGQQRGTPMMAPIVPGAPVSGAPSEVTIKVAPQAVTAAPQATPPPSPMWPVIGQGSYVYRIGADNMPELLWQSTQAIIYALAHSSRGRPLLGAGNNGELFELEPNGTFSLLVQLSSAQITAIETAPDGGWLLCTANPGKVFELGPEIARQGQYTAEPFDAKIFSRWGRLSWWGTHTDGQVAFYVRSGNTAEPDGNWSQWYGPYTAAAAEPVGAPPARFVQWKVILHATAGTPPPSLQWVSLAYLPSNLPPVIDDIAVQDPGIRLRSVEMPASAGGQESVPLRLPRPPGSAATVEAPSGIASTPPALPPQGYRQRGWQSVLWSAHDDNGDTLEYTLYYRAENETQWKLLAKGLRVPYYSWDTSSMADGAYYLKIVASDSPSNPPNLARQAERISARFVVDNTPPSVSDLQASVQGHGVVVEWTARDPGSPLVRAEYSLDGAGWVVVFPVGDLSDAPVEHYRLELHEIAAGEHTLAVRVHDQFDNQTVAKTTFSIAGESPTSRPHGME
jgi:hypothetical protein